MKRRDFFKIVATTGAAAAAGGCQQATETILPLVVPNEQLVPGVAAWFATVCRECPAGCGVLARNRDGRVVKLEGNPDHPVNRGGLCIRGQAALQGLYHPDRFAGPQRRDGAIFTALGWDDALKALGERLTAARGAGKARGVALVTQLETGSLGALMDRWTQALGTRPRVAFEPFAHEAIRAANRAAFGREAVPYYAFEDAQVILNFGADWVETWINNVALPSNFARMHAFREGRAGTYIHVEPRQSLTAANADQWVRNAPGTELMVAAALLKLVVEQGADRASGAAVAQVDPKKVADESGVPHETLTALARAHVQGKPSLVIAGGAAASGSDATQLQYVVSLLNAALGNVGKTVRFGSDWAYGKATPYAEVAKLVQAMAAGEIEVLLLGPGVNPAFTLPGGLKAVDAMRKVPFVVSFAHQPDETTALAHLILPDTHWLESWGDYVPREGVNGLMQPTMKPIRDSRPLGDVLLSVGRAVLATEEGKGPLPWAGFEPYLKAAWEPLVKGDLAAAQRQGGVWRDVPPAPVGGARAAAVSAVPATLEGDATGYVLLAYPSLRMYDGRGASRAWLQEAPDPITSVAWDGWVEIATETAKSLGIALGDVVRVTSPHGAIELPAYPTPTLHAKAVAIPIGHRYARYHVPRYVGRPATPQNPVALLSGTPEAGGGVQYLGVRVTLAKTGARRPLAVLQATFDQDHRELARHVELSAAREQALRGRTEAHEVITMYGDQRYPGYRWGMAVDVDACVGCAACVVACIAENNVPVVGKAEAAYGRQVHWLRIERWLEDGKQAESPNFFMPMFCQHCEVAPCEPVCPVFAAYRTEEGLNGQVYNRCVGTRYCGNNCPYHVRRFNWYNYDFPQPLEVQLNPDVTVRQLGVMEKCTMCIQRIMAGKDHAHRDEKRPVRDGDIVTACQQTCPTRAITFGNLKHDGSAVSKLTHSPRAYQVLDEVGTRPGVSYLRKVVREHGAPEPRAKGHA
jgi:anaerobic selenocysteine-containing dehydrogenase/Fe-S-cluster-containing dehydrogenase component